MANVTMDQIIAFRNNGDFFSNSTLPLKGAYKLNKIKKAVEKEGEFYTEKFQEIVNTYAKKDENDQLVFSEDGNQIMIKDGMVEECNKALEDLQSLEVQIENYGLTLDDLGEDVECTPDELDALMPFMD
jgi:Skp family chaperone for outer membrane proteins